MCGLNQKIAQYGLSLPLILAGFMVFSQPQEDEGVLLKQITTAEKIQHLQNSTDLTGLFIKQIGTENQAFIQQVGLGLGSLQQVGVSNVIFLQHSGNSGQLNIEQLGNANQYKGLMMGDGIETSVWQQGEYNRIDQSITVNELMFGILQEGSHNEIQHSAEGSAASLPIKIYQHGSDMRIIIKSKN